jgi:hypothetical protein
MRRRRRCVTHPGRTDLWAIRTTGIYENSNIGKKYVLNLTLRLEPARRVQGVSGAYRGICLLKSP